VRGARGAVAVLVLAALGCGEGPARVLSSTCAAFAERAEIGGDGIATGLALYRKRLIGWEGWTGAVSREPIRFARVEVVGCERGAVVGAGETDGDGRYRVPFTNPGRVGVYARVLSSAPRYASSVKRSPAEPALYGLASLAADDSGSGETLVFPAVEADGASGAFNILDQAVRGGRSVETATGSPPATPLQWYWYAGNPDGTAYDPIVRAISVSGRTEDPDEFDDAVLLHEYGHYAADVYSRDDSPGGPHRLDDSALDLRLAWSEGWATFFSSVVRNDPRHVDTSGTGVRLAFEIEGPSLAAVARYDTSELAVAAVLWDLSDDANGDEGGGPLSIPFPQTWSVVAGLSSGFTTVSFEDFWAHWLGGNLGDLTPVLAFRSIDVWTDPFEGALDDDAPARASPIGLGVIQHRTLYPAADVDYAVFTPATDGTYTVSTSRCVADACDARLSNAADTLLDVAGVAPDFSADNLTGVRYPAACGLVCPPNDAVTLSSRISFPGTAGTSYVISISRSPFAPDSAGDLGSYDVVVTRVP